MPAQARHPIRVLLIEDNPGDSRLIQEMLSAAKGDRFNVQPVDRLAHGLDHLANGEFDVVLLDLALPDGHGLESFIRAHAQAPHLPFVVLTGTQDEALAVEGVHRGAQDYLIKGQVEGELLARSIRYAIERNRLQQAVREMPLTDPLTGVNNRRGFLILATQMLILADRKQESSLLMLADLDQLRLVNETAGEYEGDRALTALAGVLRDSYRDSDILGRVSGGEFGVLLNMARVEDREVIVGRLRQHLDAFNAKSGKPYVLSVTVGFSAYRPERPRGIEELMREAEAEVRKAKQGKCADATRNVLAGDDGGPGPGAA